MSYTRERRMEIEQRVLKGIGISDTAPQQRRREGEQTLHCQSFQLLIEILCVARFDPAEPEFEALLAIAGAKVEFMPMVEYAEGPGGALLAPDESIRLRMLARGRQALKDGGLP